MARIVIRLAVPTDGRRLIADSLITGNPPAGTTWEERIAQWFGEQQRGLRGILVADDGAHLLGCVHLVFKVAGDPDIANGKDVALMEHLRVRPKTVVQVAEELSNQLVREAEALAQRRSIVALSYMVPGDNNALMAQARAWGYQQSRMMPDGGRWLMFMRKSLGGAPAPAAAPAAHPPAAPAAKPAAPAADPKGAAAAKPGTAPPAKPPTPPGKAPA